jgi:hypothetical protein
MGLGSGIRDPGSGKKTYSGFRIPDPGPGSKRNRIPDPDPQHCLNLCEPKKAEDEVGEHTIRNYHQQFCLDQQDQEANVGLPVLVFDCTGLKAVLCNRNRRNCNFLPCGTGNGTITVTCQKVGTGTVINFGFKNRTVVKWYDKSSHKRTV